MLSAPSASVTAAQAVQGHQGNRNGLPMAAPPAPLTAAPAGQSRRTLVRGLGLLLITATVLTAWWYWPSISGYWSSVTAAVVPAPVPPPDPGPRIELVSD